MSFRIVYISSQAHLSYKNNYLIVRGDEINQIHLSEINVVLIDNNMSSISIYLLNKLIDSKIKIIICDEKHNPSIDLVPYNNSFDSSKMVLKELNWNKSQCGLLWQKIIQNKIYNQAKLLDECKIDSSLLKRYEEEVEWNDSSNREGHAAKVYFNLLFGKNFSRDDICTINNILDYGYTILLSAFNRTIASHGYITQLGLHHKGPTNQFNLSCDLMEPFRPIIDKFAINNKDFEFDKNKKLEIVNLLNKQLWYENKRMYLIDVIDKYVINLLSFFDGGEIKNEWFEYTEN